MREYRVKRTVLPDGPDRVGEPTFHYRDLGACDDAAALHLWKTERAEFLASRGRYDTVGRFRSLVVELQVREVSDWSTEETEHLEVPE